MAFFRSAKRQFDKESPEQMKRELGWLWGRMLEYRRMILLVGILGLCGTVMSLVSSVASKYLIDAVTGYSTGTIGRAAAMMVTMMVGSLILQAVSSRVSASVHIRVRNRMQHTTYGRILRAAWEALEPYRSGDLLNRLNSDINTVADGIISFLPSLVTSGVKFLGAFCIMMYYDPTMALIALIGAPVTLLLSRFLMGKLRRHNLEMKELTGEVMSFQEDSFRNLTSIKAFAVTDRYEEEMGKLQGEYADAYLSFNSFQIGMSSLLSLVGMLVTAACFCWGVYQLWAGEITYGSMTMFLQLATTLRSSFSALVSLAQQTISITTSAGRIMAVEELPGENAEVPAGFGEEAEVEVSLERVSFQYQNGDSVLHTFDFTARPGDQIAITGPSGEGKTTLLRLLLGLVAPCEGTAELVGGSGTRYPITAGTRSVFAYVPQGNSVFSGTIAQNLRIVAPEATEAEMEQALKTACAWEFVKQFPEGVHHPLGAGGRGISEGQAQRLAIARALLRKAPVLLLDEATSGLDVATERRLMENLRESGLVRTCILVTHRPGSAEFCNRTYEIHHGHVTEVDYGA
ncbi:MAG: ABC transporter ATP-binding protein [Oscillospiraceae bacterium]|nr:ABC transporter ATP-binding protein [Oscillospiraceae bacterium]